MTKTLSFLLALWKVNLLSVMEYRISFLTQMLGMILNNGVYFLFWVIFFDRFTQINGWGLNEMFLLHGIVSFAFGAGVFFFGNVLNLSTIIATGQLDYYLSLPKPVLLHVLASRSLPSGAGDMVYGLLSFGVGIFVAQGFEPLMLLRYAVMVIFATAIFVSFLVIVQSLAFWIGNASLLMSNATSAIITFSLYPITLFDGTAKLLLFTLIPAALVGAVPAQFVIEFSWGDLGQLLLGVAAFLAIAIGVFHRGLRRYESGSAIQVRM